jgi:hypothetical protein
MESHASRVSDECLERELSGYGWWGGFGEARMIGGKLKVGRARGGLSRSRS